MFLMSNKVKSLIVNIPLTIFTSTCKSGLTFDNIKSSHCPTGAGGGGGGGQWSPY